MNRLDTILLALKISGIGILVLLAVLAVLALIVSLLTRFIKDAPEEEDNETFGEDNSEPVVIAEADDLGKIAAIAVAIARAQSEFSTIGESAASNFNNWGNFYLNRRLNLSSSIRRTK
jgi:Na+-transporting methylmalonyl-CoA/oxaloacetate decarboxylase gamma subunit